MENFNLSVHMLIGVLQQGSVYFFSFLFLVGLLLFALEFRNPLKRRKWFLVTIGGAAGFLVMMYLPVTVLFFQPEDISTNPEAQSLEGRIGWLKIVASSVYQAFLPIGMTLLTVLGIVGIGLKQAALKDPVVLRWGTAILIAVPLLWGLVELGPFILKVLTT